MFIHLWEIVWKVWKYVYNIKYTKINEISKIRCLQKYYKPLAELGGNYFFIPEYIRRYWRTFYVNSNIYVYCKIVGNAFNGSIILFLTLCISKKGLIKGIKPLNTVCYSKYSLKLLLNIFEYSLKNKDLSHENYYFMMRWSYFSNNEYVNKISAQYTIGNSL